MKINIEETSERFTERPSESAMQRAEANIEGVSIDYSSADTGIEPSVAPHEHENLKEIDNEMF